MLIDFRWYVVGGRLQKMIWYLPLYAVVADDNNVASSLILLLTPMVLQWRLSLIIQYYY